VFVFKGTLPQMGKCEIARQAIILLQSRNPPRDLPEDAYEQAVKCRITYAHVSPLTLKGKCYFRLQGRILTWICRYESYVYWNVHHLDSWIKRDQLDVTCFFISLFNAQHVSGVNTSILRSLRLICWVISWVVLLWFDVCWCYVVVWLR